MHLAFTFQETHIECDVAFGRRKTMAIIVAHDGQVRVAAPKGTSRKVIVNWVSSKSEWILKKLDQVNKAKSDFFPQQYAHGEMLMYLGRKYPLQLEIDLDAARPMVDISHGALVVKTPVADTEAIQPAVRDWCQRAAKDLILDRVEYFSDIIKVKPHRVTIRQQRTRWGSCSAQGNLNFNWKVIMAPAEVVDYLVVHEMCHLVHHNHSQEFWNLVATYLPDYKLRKAWLKKNGPILSV